jgi:uncharacterized heparinase superfamily protein
VKRGPDRSRLYGLALREAGRAALASVAVAPRLLSPSAKRVLIAPQDLRTSDPTIASDVYAGCFVFAGRAVSTGGRSPFACDPPSRAWAEALYGFGWLRHLRAAETALARANGRALVAEFLDGRPAGRRVARSTPVLARRTVSFLAQSPLLLEGADHDFYRRFLRAIDEAAHELDRDMRFASQPLHRLTAAIALCYVGLCCEGLEARLRRTTAILARELDRQILPDGGHRSRNPKVAIELLLDLLPLRQSYSARSLEPPQALTGAIDRMLPLLRLLRLGDGGIARFNGMGRSAADELATLLTYEGARGRPMRRAPHSGYERLEAGETVLVADVGPAPAVADAAEAHAGCLSFELSSAAQAIVVNCGTARGAGDETGLAARSTAAHSTATIGEVSSGRFLMRQGAWPERLIAAWLIGRLGPALMRGPAAVAVERQEEADDKAQVLRASQDGYRELGLAHARRWRLSGRGDRLDGEDTFTRTGTDGGAEPATIRFHLAPGVRASLNEAGSVLLALPSGEAWQFSAERLRPELEDSAFFAAAEGMRRTTQIVLRLDTAASATVRWRFERVPPAPAREAGRKSAAEPPPLP